MGQELSCGLLCELSLGLFQGQVPVRVSLRVGGQGQTVENNGSQSQVPIQIPEPNCVCVCVSVCVKIFKI